MKAARPADTGDLGANWQDTLIAHLLLREARAGGK
jgi:hypothetical protein